jgi:hypothetical protein
MLIADSVAQRVEISTGITSEKDRPRSNILDRESKSVKFHSDRIITG